jgi:hypothetical protein
LLKPSKTNTFGNGMEYFFASFPLINFGAHTNIWSLLSNDAINWKHRCTKGDSPPNTPPCSKKSFKIQLVNFISIFH